MQDQKGNIKDNTKKDNNLKEQLNMTTSMLKKKYILYNMNNNPKFTKLIFQKRISSYARDIMLSAI